MNKMEEDTIDLLELAKALWKNILIIALVAVLDLIAIGRTLPSAARFGRIFLKPVLASLIMGAAAWAGYGLLSRFFGNTLSVLGAIVAAVIVYFLLVVALRMLSKEDLALMPKGEKIGKILRL